MYDDAAGKVNVIIKQTQKSGKFLRLPIAIDIYNGANKVRHNVWVKNAVDTFTFNYSKRPDLVNVDGDKVFSGVKKIIKQLTILFININMQAIILTDSKLLSSLHKNKMIRKLLNC